MKNVENYEYQKIIMYYRNVKDTEQGKNKKKERRKNQYQKISKKGKKKKRNKKEYAKEYKKIDTKILCLKR